MFQSNKNRVRSSPPSIVAAVVRDGTDTSLSRSLSFAPPPVLSIFRKYNPSQLQNHASTAPAPPFQANGAGQRHIRTHTQSPLSPFRDRKEGGKLCHNSFLSLPPPPLISRPHLARSPPPSGSFLFFCDVPFSFLFLRGGTGFFIPPFRTLKALSPPPLAPLLRSGGYFRAASPRRGKGEGQKKSGNYFSLQFSPLRFIPSSFRPPVDGRARLKKRELSSFAKNRNKSWCLHQAKLQAHAP